MANGEGALVAQQSAAAKIAYENIANDPFSHVLNAFALGVEINKKRQAMEAQMERLILQKQKMDQDRDLKEQEFGLKQTALTNLADYRGQQLGLAEDRFHLATELKDAQVEDTSSLYNDLASMTSKPGDSDFTSKLNEIYSKHSRAALTPTGRQTQRLYEQQHNTSVAKQTSSVKSDYDLFAKDVSNRLFQGGKPDMTMFDLPQMWQKQVDKDGKETGLWYVPAGMEKFHHKNKDGTMSPVQHYGTMTESDKNAFIKRYQSIKDRMNKLPQQISNPDTGTQPINVTSGSAPPPQTSSGSEVTRSVNGRKAVFDSNTKQFVRWSE